MRFMKAIFDIFYSLFVRRSTKETMKRLLFDSFPLLGKFILAWVFEEGKAKIVYYGLRLVISVLKAFFSLVPDWKSKLLEILSKFFGRK